MQAFAAHDFDSWDLLVSKTPAMAARGCGERGVWWIRCHICSFLTALLERFVYFFLMIIFTFKRCADVTALLVLNGVMQTQLRETLRNVIKGI